MLTFHDLLLQSVYTRNFLILLPFLFLGGLILFLLNRADSLRAGAGLVPPHRTRIINPQEPQSDSHNLDPDLQPQPQPEDGDEDGDEDDDENAQYNHEDEVDISDLLAEAGGGPSTNANPANNDNLPPGAAPTAKPPRIVGKKKARNLELRDQRRAYHEFMQSQARDRRSQTQALEQDLQDTLFEEKQRRALAEINIEKRKIKEKQDRADAELLNAKHVQALRRLVDSLAVSAATTAGTGATTNPTTGRISLRTLGHRVGKDEEWVRKTIKEEKIVPDRGAAGGGGGNAGGVVTFVTDSGWLVRIGPEELAAVVKRVEAAGQMSWDDLGEELERSLNRL
ncbi:hypothetical protein DRE_06820 [Drechslerella stenobrocha 248]|uniref:Uncharacterized protein n=1 Tax=Drechslerella stenobrocha 248 TaxID=1043628 RepID=W7HWK9_9PEZI|nr:hypothetical protein DRE_06820 [Drechslerella stenobrocha 248]